MMRLFSLYKEFLDGKSIITLRVMQVFAVSAIAVYLAPYVLLGSGNHWMIWDNLDSNFVAYKVLIESGSLFASNDTVIEQPLGGVPRSTMPSELDAFVWLFSLLGPEGAYVANRVLMTVVGFFGMYLLLRRHIIKSNEDEIVRIGVALCFAILPFWPFGGLSVAGMPLALYAMLEIRNRNYSWWNWAIVILYPFYSNLVLSGFFFLVLVALIWICDILRRKTVMPLFLGLTVMSAFYIITHYRLFIEFLVEPNFVSHRTEFGSFNKDNFSEAAKNTLGTFIQGKAHSYSLQRYVILPLCAFSALLMLPRSRNDHSKWLFWLILFGLGGIALLHGFKSTPALSSILVPIKAILPMQFDRFYFLYPLLWMLIFALVLSILRAQSRLLTLMIIAVVALQSVYAFRYHELIRNRNDPSVGQFLAEEQFSKIQDYIDKPLDSYRVASIGIHPSVALYNGFHTLDGYWPNYPLSYKRDFRNIIAGELEKDDALKKYYDDWGSRVYLFNEQTGRNMVIEAENEIKLRNLDYNWEKFSELGGRFVLSAAEIDVSGTPQVTLLKKFSDATSAWDVYLYRVAPD